MDPFTFVIRNADAVMIGLCVLSLICGGLVAWEIRRKTSSPVLVTSMIAPLSFLATASLMILFGQNWRTLSSIFVLLGIVCGPVAAIALLVLSGVAFMNAQVSAGFSRLLLCLTNAAVGPVLFFFSLCCD